VRGNDFPVRENFCPAGRQDETARFKDGPQGVRSLIRKRSKTSNIRRGKVLLFSIQIAEKKMPALEKSSPAWYGVFMAIITISRELAALGDETAQELSRRLGYRFIDRGTLEERIKSFGMGAQVLEKYDERRPGFIAGLLQDRDDYLHFLKLAMLEEAVADGKGCVFIGRGACAVLADIPGVVPVFLVSNRDVRIERVRSYFHCNEKKARSIIEQSDRDRTGFYKYFFESEWKEPGNYRISLNTSRLPPAVCAQIIEQLCASTASAGAETVFAQKLADAHLAQKVIHRVLYEREVRVHFLDVTVNKGDVTLFGVTSAKAVIDKAAVAAQEVPGVKKVVQAIQVVEEYNIIH
jgi:cytidylate kinase